MRGFERDQDLYAAQRPEPEIEPGRAYELAIARQLIPGGCEDGCISLSALHRWRRAGLFRGEFRRGPKGGRRWFIRGRDLAQLIEMEAEAGAGDGPAPRSRSESARDYRQAVAAAEATILGSYDILAGRA
jgi:hypothetical protein